MKPTAVIGVPSTSDTSAYQENRDLLIMSMNKKLDELRERKDRLKLENERLKLELIELLKGA